MQRRRVLTDEIEKARRLDSDFADAQALTELAEEGEAVGEDLSAALDKLQADLEELEFSLMLDGEFDRNNAIVSIHSGAGGTEAQDWAEMLLRMLTRWAERHGYKVELVDQLEGEEAGLKSEIGRAHV